MMVVYNIILDDATVGLLFRIKNIECSKCIQLPTSNQTKKYPNSKMIHHKRSDRGRQSNHFDLIEKEWQGNVSKSGIHKK
jgi:hypothetical protein